MAACAHPPSRGGSHVNALHTRRRLANGIALVLSFAAMAFGLVWLIWILFEVCRLGFAGLTPSLFTKMTPPPGSEGGLLNAIVGSMILVGFAMFIATPIGICAGIYLAEYGERSRLAAVTRFVNDILLSAPSIVIGLFVYAVLVSTMKSFSAIAGIAALALIVVPVVTRTTENILALVPNSLREAAFALGAPKWKVVTRVSARAARAGIVTGVLLAAARISGETAPLLFTALSNQFWSVDLTEPIANLPVTIFKFAMSPFADWQQLAWAGVFLITVGVLALNVVARIIFREGRA